MVATYTTIEQQIAAKAAELTRLLDKQRRLEHGQKSILGGFLLNEVKADAKIRTWLLRRVAETVTRDVDKKRLAPLLEDLQAMGTATVTNVTTSSRASESTQVGADRKT